MLLSILSVQSFAQTFTSGAYKSGTNGGFFYSFWNQGGGSVTLTLGDAGNYSVKWNNIENFTCGKGWATGSNSPVCYSATFDGGSNGYLALYGWTENTLIEYYIVECYGAWTPPGGTSLGTLTSDSGTYKIYKTQRVNQPSVIGNATFYQYWSVRTTKRTSGTITVKNHFDAWASHSMPLGTKFDYLIMESEGYKSSGSSDVTILNCNTSTIDNVDIKTIHERSTIHSAGNNILLTMPTDNLFNPTRVAIFNIAGRKVFTSTIQPDNAQYRILTPGLSAGTYYASIQNRNENSVISFVK